MTKEITGRHVAMILIGFFGIVIAVNLLMARLAVTTFGGALAENGYVASQDYNKWIAESAAQDKLGWAMTARIEDRYLLIDTRGAAAPTLDVIAQHPLGRVDDQKIAMVLIGPGQFRSAKSMPEGRWKLHVIMSQGSNKAEYMQEVRG